MKNRNEEKEEVIKIDRNVVNKETESKLYQVHWVTNGVHLIKRYKMYRMVDPKSNLSHLVSCLVCTLLLLRNESRFDGLTANAKAKCKKLAFYRFQMKR